MLNILNVRPPYLYTPAYHHSAFINEPLKGVERWNICF